MYSCTMRQLADMQLKATLMCSSNSMATCRAGSQRGWRGRDRRAAPVLPWLGLALPLEHPHPPPRPTCRMSQLTFHWRMLLKRQVLTTSPTARSMRISLLLAMPRISSFLLPLNLVPGAGESVSRSPPGEPGAELGPAEHLSASFSGPQAPHLENEGSLIKPLQ